MKLGITVLRVAIGGLLIGHGTQKLFGWFGGGGPDGTGRFFDSVGLRPGRTHALRAGAVEAGGGALLAAGLLTPLAAGGITAVMTTAIRTVHGPNGPWASDGGYEYNLALIAAMAALADAGPGEISIDRQLGIDRSGPAIAAAAVAGGVGGSYLAARPDAIQPAS